MVREIHSRKGINTLLQANNKNSINISPDVLKNESVDFLKESITSKLSDIAFDLGTGYYTSYMLPYQVPYLINGLKSQIGNTLTKCGLSALQ